MQPIRQGDVLLLPTSELQGVTLPHLVLAEGEVTGHKHQISAGEVDLYQSVDRLYLQVRSQTATLSHEEHKTVEIPQGNWMIRIQREYVPEEERVYVSKRYDSEVSNVQYEWDDSDVMWDLVSD